MKLSKYQKKEGGNLATRDFTDDLYNMPVRKEMFVEDYGSQLFTNLLVVLPKTRVDNFATEVTTLMAEYYDVVDQMEDKRIPDMAKTRLTELRDKDHDGFAAFCEKAGLSTNEDEHSNEDWQESARAAMTKIVKDEVARKRAHRMPNVVVPDATASLNLTDKEGNQVFRMVAYAAQAEDFVKAARRKGLTARPFNYNKQQWEDDNMQMHLLKQELENKTTTLNQMAVDSF